MFDWIGLLCIAGAAFGCIHVLAACALVRRFPRRPTHRSAGAAPPITVLKPLYGAEPGLFERLSSLCTQDYPAPVQIVLATQDRTDPASEVAHRLKATFPEKQIVSVEDPRQHGPNRKISNLVNMLPLARHDVLVIADSDIAVGPKYLSILADELQQPTTGAVTCLYHGIAGAGLWSKLSAMAINSHFLPEVVTSLTFRLAQPCFGATIAMRRQTLTQIGGFAAFAGCLADDHMIGRAVRSCGYAVAIPACSVGHVCFERTVDAFLARQIRFARTIKSIDPIGYAGLILTHPFPLALLAALLSIPGGLLVAALALGCRAALCIFVQRAFHLERQHYWLIPFLELVLFAIYVAGLFGTRVSWRGDRYGVRSDGTLVEIEK
jgi:ceramide glucosyltransferase